MFFVSFIKKSNWLETWTSHWLLLLQCIRTNYLSNKVRRILCKYTFLKVVYWIGAVIFEWLGAPVLCICIFMHTTIYSGFALIQQGLVNVCGVYSGTLHTGQPVCE